MPQFMAPPLEVAAGNGLRMDSAACTRYELDGQLEVQLHGLERDSPSWRQPYSQEQKRGSALPLTKARDITWTSPL